MNSFNAIELSFSETGTISFDTDIDKLMIQYDALKQKGIEFSSISTLLYNKYSFCASYLTEVHRCIDIAERMIDIASILGIGTVSISLGKIESGSYWDNFNRLEQIVEHLGDYAYQNNVCMCIENIVGNVLVSPIEYALLLEHVKSDFIGICLDTGNAQLIGKPEFWLDVLENKVKKIHITDITHRRSFPMFVSAGKGEVDWEGLSKYNIFHEIEYLTLECFWKNTMDAMSWINECSFCFDKVLGRLASNVGFN